MMDRDLQHLKVLWQEEKSTPLDLEPLITYLNKVESISRLRRIIGLGLSSLFVIFFWSSISFNVYNTIASILLGFGLFVLCIALYKSRSKVIYSALNLKNQEFLSFAVRRLKLRLLVPRVQMLVFIICFFIALNIELWMWLNETEILFRILAHLSLAVFTFLMILVRRFGMDMYNKQIIPLIKRLERVRLEE